MAKFSNDELNKIAEILSPLDKDPIKNETLNPTAKILRKIKGLPEPQFDEDTEVEDVQVDENYEDEPEIPTIQDYVDEHPDLDLEALLKSAEKFNEGGTLSGIEAVDENIPDDFTHNTFDNNIDTDLETSEEDELTIDKSSNETPDFNIFDDSPPEDDPIADTNPFKAVSEADTNPFAKIPVEAEDENPFGDISEANNEVDPFGNLDSTTEEDPFATPSLNDDATPELNEFGGLDDFDAEPKASDEEDPFGTPGLNNDATPELDEFGGVDDFDAEPKTSDDEDPFATPNLDDEEQADVNQFSGLDDIGSGADDFSSISQNNLEEEDPFATAAFNTVDEEKTINFDDEKDDSNFEIADQDPYSDFTPSTGMEDDFGGGTNLGDNFEEGYNANLTGGSLDTIEYNEDNSTQNSGSYDTLDEDLDSLAEEDESEKDELSDEELAIIQQEIVNYPPKLKRAVIDAVTNNKLSKMDERGLIELIKTSQKPEDVASYLTEKLGYEVELFDKSGAYSSRGIPVIATKDIYTKEGELKRSQLIKRTALIAAAVLFGLIALVSSYKYGLKPFQASRHYDEGLEAIKKAGTLKNPTERTRLLADAKSAFAKGEKIEPNDLEYLNKFGMAYMKIGEYDQAFEKLFGVVEPDFGGEPNGENEAWTKRQEVPLIQLSPKSSWNNDKLPLGGRIVPDNEYMILESGNGKRKVERKIRRAGAYIVSRLEKNIHDNTTYISLGKFHSNIANLFQKPKLDGNRSYKNDNLAINYYKEVFTDGEEPDNIEATAGLAKVYYNQQNFAKSVFFYNKIVDKFPTNPIGNGGLLSNYIEMWKKDNNPTFVLDHHRRVRNSLNIEDDLSLFVLTKLASFYIDLTTNDVRIKYNINPEDQVTDMELQDNIEHLLNIAFNKKEKSDNGEVVKGDEYSEGYYQRGRFFLKRGETIQALKQFELSAQYDSAHYLSVLEMAEHNMRVSNYSDSLDLLDNAKNRYETYKDYYGNKEEDETLFYGDYGRIYFDKGKIAYLESALVAKEGKITEFPDRKVYPERSLGKLTEEESNRRKNLNTAMMMFEKAEEFKLQNPSLKREMYYYKGWIEYMRSDYEEAINQWSNLSEDDIYTNVNVMFGRANSFYNLNQLNAALGNFIKIKEDFEEKESQIARPSSDESIHQEIYNVLVAVYNNIGAIYEQKGNTSEALKHYWKSIEIARKIDITTEIPNHNKDFLFKNKREGNEPLLDDWLSPTIGTVKELLSTKKGKF